MKSNIILTSFIILLFLACNQNKKEIEVKDFTLEKIDSDTPPPPPPPSINSLKSVNEDFSTFWQTFRTAVLKSDTIKIMELTEFPFQTRGTLDSDSIIKYNRSQFVRVFNSFLNQWSGDIPETTERDGIKKTVTPNKADIQPEYTRIGDLVFRKHNKRWMLTFAYSE